MIRVLALLMSATFVMGSSALAAAPKCKSSTGAASKWTCTSDIKAKGQRAKAVRTMPLWGLRARNRL